MNYLKERILKDGKVYPNNVLKVDSFLNHQIDPAVVNAVEKLMYEHFKDRKITKVMTIEASGIAPAIMVANRFNVPMLFAKKTVPSTLKNQERYHALVHSYTKNTDSDVIVSKQYINKDDHILIIDDFLANGEAAKGLVSIARQAGATVAGVGIVIEKSFQPGRQLLEEMGLDVYSICRIQSLEDGQVTFVDGDE
ncbi:xanthine phosphoribosyltransferase [Atopobacter sp. AH10]|uniref:xanthine phosphoribosyltransferase n=1 Tax=Atopobacter sp. AH10 TaxID=2315861 RepID=UPI000EF1EB12|nr:xanthine phosphoribosyltransferase [Atopobacter sp. AH10]RLK62807.1 xanthine phosphoribosyltransferase [Atopobacter sp. AH10]